MSREQHPGLLGVGTIEAGEFGGVDLVVIAVGPAVMGAPSQDVEFVVGQGSVV